MTASVPSRSIVALALCAAAAMALLALPGALVGAGAQHAVRIRPDGRSPACAPRLRPLRARVKGQGPRAAHGQGTSLPAQRRQAQSREAAPGARAGEEEGKVLDSREPDPGDLRRRQRPVSTGGGRFSCDDESEPMCEDGSPPVPSQDGSRLECKVSAKAGASEASCEDGSAPVLAGEGQFSCDDESEPACEDGTAPTLSSGSSLVCDAGPPARSDGWAARTAQSPGGMRRQLASGS